MEHCLSSNSKGRSTSLPTRMGAVQQQRRATPWHNTHILPPARVLHPPATQPYPNPFPRSRTPAVTAHYPHMQLPARTPRRKMACCVTLLK